MPPATYPAEAGAKSTGTPDPESLSGCAFLVTLELPPIYQQAPFQAVYSDGQPLPGPQHRLPPSAQHFWHDLHAATRRLNKAITDHLPSLYTERTQSWDQQHEVQPIIHSLDPKNRTPGRNPQTRLLPADRYQTFAFQIQKALELIQTTRQEFTGAIAAHGLQQANAKLVAALTAAGLPTVTYSTVPDPAQYRRQLEQNPNLSPDDRIAALHNYHFLNRLLNPAAGNDPQPFPEDAAL